MMKTHPILTLLLCAFFLAPAVASAQQPSASPPPDAAGAQEEEVTTATQQWGQKLATGGWTIVFQIALSVLGGTYAIGSFLRFRRGAIAPKGMVEDAERLWQEGKYDELERLAHDRPSTLSRIISFLVTERGSTSADLSTAAGDMAAREMARHAQRAYPLAIVATLEPLLGLLGTVIGMIESFDTVALAGSLGDASLLAGGISKALVTTAVGLIIAIPFLGLYHHFRNKAAEYTILLEEDLTQLIRHWFIKPEAAAAKAQQP